MACGQSCSRVETGTPIDNLPDECLGDIFSRVAVATPRAPRIGGSLDNHLVVSHPLHCAAVCKRWQAAVGPSIKSLRFDITAPAAEALIQHAPRFISLTRTTIAIRSPLGPTTFADLLAALAANTPRLEELILEPSYHVLEPSCQMGLALALMSCLPAWTHLRSLSLGRLLGEGEGESLALLDSLEQITSLRELEVNLLDTEVLVDTVSERLVRLTGIPVIKMSTGEAPAPSMTSLSNLKQLNIQSCDDVLLLDRLGDLRSLTGLKLDLAFEPMGLPDSIGNLTALRQLVLDNCYGLTTLPDSLGDLVALNHLEINDCQHLASLPNSLGNLHALRHLSICYSMMLSELPASIGELRQLTNLEVLGESFQGLPHTVSQLRELNLLALGFSSELKLLPSGIGAMGNLRVLDIRSCPLVELPASICQLARLSQLTASSCSSLKRLPRHIGQLQGLVELHLHDNRDLELLPDGIADLTSLTTLDISKCPKLQHLPKRVTHLTRLQNLKIHQSAPEVQKDFLPDGAVATLQGLRELTVDAGPVEGPWLPLGLTRLSGLERLEVWGTSLEQQPQVAQGGWGILGVLGGLFRSGGYSRYSSLQALQRLQYLTLETASCELLPQELMKMPALMRLTWHTTPAGNSLPSNRKVVEALKGEGCTLHIKVAK